MWVALIPLPTKLQCVSCDIFLDSATALLINVLFLPNYRLLLVPEASTQVDANIEIYFWQGIDWRWCTKRQHSHHITALSSVLALALTSQNRNDDVLTWLRGGHVNIGFGITA
jgi:hypothetical protein